MRQASEERRSAGALAARLRSRREEIEAAALTRVLALAGIPDAGDAEYAHGLRSAASAGIGYGIEAIDRDSYEPAPVPEALLEQARRAARSGVGLDTVLRRYVAGQALLGDFLVQEAEGRVAPAELKRALRGLAATLDCLLAAVTTAYGQEERRHRRSAEERRGDLVERLLAGEPLDPSKLDYELKAFHLGLVACGPGAGEALSALPRAFDARLLVISRDEEDWGWLGTREPLDPAEVACFLGTNPAELTAAIGEPGEGLSGWRSTHRQARAALPIARRDRETCVSYTDVGLLATVVQDDLLTSSLRRRYLDPLSEERDGGESLRVTLRAYFAAERNISSTAAALGIDRRTVSSRLRTVESRIHRGLTECVADLQLVMRLEELQQVR